MSYEYCFRGPVVGKDILRKGNQVGGKGLNTKDCPVMFLYVLLFAVVSSFIGLALCT